MGIIFLFLFFNSAMAAEPLDVVINEIAWMGNTASANQEWIELRNNANIPINLDGWILKAVDGSPVIELTGKISADGFYLLERSKNYTGALENNGEILELYDNFGNLIDKVDASSGWPAGDNKTKQTMERTISGWQTSPKAGAIPKIQNSAPTTKAAAAIIEPFEAVQGKPSSIFVFLIAGILAILSGVTIAIINQWKKKLF